MLSVGDSYESSGRSVVFKTIFVTFLIELLAHRGPQSLASSVCLMSAELFSKTTSINVFQISLTFATLS